MVGTINSTTSGAAAFGVEARSRPQLTLTPKNGAADAAKDVANASVSEAQSIWQSARDSVADGLAALDLALAAGRDALSKLTQIGDAARGGGDVQAALDAYAAGLDQAGAGLLLGEDLHVQAEPGAPDITVEGLDVRLGAAVTVPPSAANADPAAIARSASDGVALLQAHLTKLDSAARALEAHAGFLGAASSTTGVRTDVDADGARLLALQVRQGLEGAGVGIANVQPQAVLSLFKSA